MCFICTPVWIQGLNISQEAYQQAKLQVHQDYICMGVDNFLGLGGGGGGGGGLICTQG